MACPTNITLPPQIILLFRDVFGYVHKALLKLMYYHYWHFMGEIILFYWLLEKLDEKQQDWTIVHIISFSKILFSPLRRKTSHGSRIWKTLNGPIILLQNERLLHMHIDEVVKCFISVSRPLQIWFPSEDYIHTPQSFCQLSELVTSSTSLSKRFQLSVALLLFVSLLLLSLSFDLLLSYFRLEASSMHIQIRLLYNY